LIVRSVAALTVTLSMASHAQTMQNAGWQPDLVCKDESNCQNVPNYRFDKHHTAMGYWQITDTNWLRVAPTLDIDTHKYPNAMSAPRDVQAQVGAKMYADTGYLPWVPYNARLRRDLEWFWATKAFPQLNVPPNVQPSSTNSPREHHPGNVSHAAGGNPPQAPGANTRWNPFIEPAATPLELTFRRR
jgi:hypothetical protein